MKILVIGATGGSGRAAVAHALSEGHEVTAFSRQATVPAGRPRGLRWYTGDALDPADVARAVRGQDAVIVTLGIREPPLRVRLLGPARTPINVRSAGTRNVIAAMRAHGVRRLVVQTTYGVGATRDRLRLVEKVFFKLLLKPQIDDTEVQDTGVAQSGLDWVIVQPVHLTDGPEDDMPFASTDGHLGRMSVSRNSVGRFLTRATTSPAFVHRTVAISGAPRNAN